MSSEFGSIEEAKIIVASLMGGDLDTFKEISGVHVRNMGHLLLDDPDTPEETKEQIRKEIDAQKAFTFNTKDGREVKIVISPFRRGFDCWVLTEKGFAVRI